MIAVPAWLKAGVTVVAAGYTLIVAGVVALQGSMTAAGAVALALYVVALSLCATGAADTRLPMWRTVVVVAAGVLLPVLGSSGLDPVRDSYASGAWYVAAIVGLTLQMLWRRRAVHAWVVAAALVLHTYAWGGLDALVSYAVVAAVLITAVVSAGGWAVSRTQQDLVRYAAAEREALEWRAAQDAYHRERQVRLATTGGLAAPLLQRIVDSGGALTEEDRFECRVLEQTIRDEIRGRHLLNDAVRAQVIAHRRRGVAVQVNDDGGLDDLDPALVEPLLDRVALALDGLRSDRIIIRTLSPGSRNAVSVVATSSDPLAAALGLEDEDEQVDLWLELERPGLAAV